MNLLIQFTVAHFPIPKIKIMPTSDEKIKEFSFKKKKTL